MKTWPILKAGDQVDVVAPGSGAPLDAIQKGIETLKSWGLQVRFPEESLKPSTFFAHDDAERLRLLKKALFAKDSQAVWFIRGGSGTHRLLPSLFKKGLKKPSRPKLVLGFSDATSLHAALAKHWGWSSLHAPVLTQLGPERILEEHKEKLRRLLMGEETEIVFSDLEPMNQKAKALRKPLHGKLFGGNLTVFQTLIGTADFPRMKNGILFFEDVGERGYRLDRTLNHLRQAGVFDGIQAVVLGDFTGGDEPSAPGGPVVNRVNWALEAFARELSLPVFAGLPAGHGDRNRAFPLNWPVEIQDSALRISLVGTSLKGKG